MIKQVLLFTLIATGLAQSADAFGGGLLSRLRNRDSSAPSQTLEGKTTLTYGDRTLYVHEPAKLPPSGKRALVLVLHGGMGNAQRIATGRSEAAMNLDKVADKYGFLVAYLNGTPVTKRLGADKEGWNAGYCCGVPAQTKVDDLGYLTGAVKFLSEKYGVDPTRVYGIGHSNGAMMTQRLICEAGVLAKGISVSGTLNIETTSCTGAKGRTILEIHGKNDTSVPLEGGYGEGISNKNYKTSQEYAEKTITASGGKYILEIIPAEHKMDTIESAIETTQHTTLAEKTAKFFDLVK